MITLNLVENEGIKKELFLKAGLTQNGNSLCLWAKSGEDVLGYSIFDLDDTRISVRYIEPLGDIPLADGILRSSLHVAAERFVMDAFYTDTLSEEFLEKIDFIKSREEKRLDIDKLFKSCCSCGK